MLLPTVNNFRVNGYENDAANTNEDYGKGCQSRKRKSTNACFYTNQQKEFTRSQIALALVPVLEVQSAIEQHQKIGTVF